MRPEPTPRNAAGIEACAREPIHLSGAIQPHGYLVSCALPDWTVCHASANIDQLLDVEAAELVGETLRDYISFDLLQAVVDTVGFLEPGTAPQRIGTTNLGAMGALCDVSAHLAEGMVHLEIEPQSFHARQSSPALMSQAMIARVGAAEEGGDFHQLVAAQVRQLTGYDRVMVYRFRHDQAGEVIAEDKADDLESYLGLRYPASDIPPQARALYLQNRLRVIPDAGYEPVPIVPAFSASGKPLDLSQHVLRSVSPVHLQYLRNMGVGASMSISIIAGGRLWGLIACHHRAPRHMPPAVRASADLFGLFVSMRVAAMEQQDTMAGYEEAERVRDAVQLRLAGAQDFDASLAGELGVLRDALGSDGAGLWMGGGWRTVGAAPDRRHLPAIARWLRNELGSGTIGMSHNVREWSEPGVETGGVAGVMALCLGGRDDWLLLFRNEQVHDVTWAGEPGKALVATDDGMRIAPRRSFAAWRETVRGCSVAWSDSDRRAGERMHRILHQLRRRSLARAEDMPGLDYQQQRQALGDHRERLSNLAQLLDGLVHLDGEAVATLNARIRHLEDDLRGLMRGAMQGRPESGELDAAAG